MSRAAAEFGVTPGAVRHAVTTQRAGFGAPSFRRPRSRLTLTEEADRLYAELRYVNVEPAS